MNTLFEIPDKEYILNNHQNICIYCKDNVQEVRDYLETVCGFKKASWATNSHLNLVWMYLGSDGCVHGDPSEEFWTGRTKCTIDSLLDECKLYNGCKPINLKGLTV